MKKRLLIIGLVISVFMLISCSGGSTEEDEFKEPEAESFLAHVTYDAGSEPESRRLWIESVEIVLENDMESIVKHGLLQRDFQNGFAWVPTGVIKGYYTFDDKTSMDLGEFSDLTQSSVVADVTVKGDYLGKISEIDFAEIKRQLYPMVDDGSEVANNGGHYLKYGEDLYYREYTHGSFEDIAILNDFPYDPYGISRIVKISSEGKKEVVWEGHAYGEFFIYENMDGEMLLVQNQFAGTEDETAHISRYTQAFVADLEGRTIFEYEGGTVYKIDQLRRLAVIEGYRNNIEVMDLETGAVRTLTDEYCSPLVYDYEDGMLYYENYEALAMQGENTYVISRININGGQNIDLAVLDAEFMKTAMNNDYPMDYYVFINSRVSGDFLYTYFAGYEGNGSFLGAYVLLKIDKQGNTIDIVEEPTDRDWFGMEKVFNLRVDSPFVFESYDYYYYDNENILDAKTVLEAGDLNSLGYARSEYYGDDGSVSIANIEYVDGVLFFTVVEGIRAEEEDIGWREAYRLKGGRTYKKDMAGGEIELLYEY